MEFMLSEALPIYSGGLGNVAGDQLKAASDLGVPVVGVGLLYQHGYFRQVIDRDGAQQALYPTTTPGSCRSRRCASQTASGCAWRSRCPGSVWLRAWQVQVGRRKALPARHERRGQRPRPPGNHQRAVRRRAGAAPEAGDRARDRRLAAARALGIKPEVCHLNEGHAAFALLERARGFMKETGQPFAVALAATRAGNLFTTHTAVAAGIRPVFPRR
jgi:glycogen phosphorylase